MLGSLELCCYLILNNNTFLFFLSLHLLLYLSSVNDYVGFGFMDATKMVDAALNWTTVPTKVNCTIPDPRGNR